MFYIYPINIHLAPSAYFPGYNTKNTTLRWHTSKWAIAKWLTNNYPRFSEKY